PTGQLDLNDNDLVIDYSAVSPMGTWTGSAYDGIAGQIAAGVIKSSAMTSSLYALGVSESFDTFGAQGGNFSGETVDSSAVLVKFTYGGDANLDGKLPIDDYVHVDMASNAVEQFWSNGDFNFDGKINIDDYSILDATPLNAGPIL